MLCALKRESPHLLASLIAILLGPLAVTGNSLMDSFFKLHIIYIYT